MLMVKPCNYLLVLSWPKKHLFRALLFRKLDQYWTSHMGLASSPDCIKYIVQVFCLYCLLLRYKGWPNTAMPGRCSVSWPFFRNKNRRRWAKNQLTASQSSILPEDHLKKKSPFLELLLPPNTRVPLLVPLAGLSAHLEWNNSALVHKVLLKTWMETPLLNIGI